MSTGSTANYNIPYPLSTDPVDVANDIQDLADRLDTFLLNPVFINNVNIDGGSIITPALSANLFNTNSTTLNIGGSATSINIGSGSGQTNFAGHINIATGKVYEINNVSILSSTTLGSSVINSSLTSVGTISTGTWNATTIAVNKGGTGLTSYAVGDLVYASASTTLAKLAGVATGNALISGGVGTAPSWGKIGLTTHISGILPIANGGTNGTAAPTSGGVAYGNGTSFAFTSAGTNNHVLTSNGTVPGWTANTGTGNVVRATSPTLSGTPLSTTASVDTNTTQIATTAFVIGQGYLKSSTASSTYAPIASPTFTGTISSTGTTIIMNSDASSGEDVFFKVERGSDPDVEIRWNDSGDAWQFTNDGTTYFDIPTSAGGGAGLEAVLMFAGM
jgi:hypothetical protein